MFARHPSIRSHRCCTQMIKYPGFSFPVSCAATFNTSGKRKFGGQFRNTRRLVLVGSNALQVEQNNATNDVLHACIERGVFLRLFILKTRHRDIIEGVRDGLFDTPPIPHCTPSVVVVGLLLFLSGWAPTSWWMDGCAISIRATVHPWYHFVAPVVLTLSSCGLSLSTLWY